IRCGIGVSNAAANRAAIAHLHITDFGSSLGEQRALRAQQFRGDDLRVRDERADGDFVALFADVIHSSDPADVNDIARRGETQLHHGQQAVASGENFCFVTVASKRAKGFIESFRSLIFEFGWNHRALPDFAFARGAGFCKRLQMRSRLMGKSTCVMPSGASASTTALTTHGVAPMVPASPTPFTPMGLTGVGVTVREVSMRGISAACGKA